MKNKTAILISSIVLSVATLSPAVMAHRSKNVDKKETITATELVNEIKLNDREKKESREADPIQPVEGAVSQHRYVQFRP